MNIQNSLKPLLVLISRFFENRIYPRYILNHFILYNILYSIREQKQCKLIQDDGLIVICSEKSINCQVLSARLDKELTRPFDKKNCKKVCSNLAKMLAQRI